MNATQEEIRAEIELAVARLNSAMGHAARVGLRTDATTETVRRADSASYDRIKVAVSLSTRPNIER